MPAAPPIAPAAVRHASQTSHLFTSLIPDVAACQWHLTDEADGVVQMLSLHVEQEYLRRGFGSKLLRGVMDHAAKVLAERGHRLRRIFIAVRQKQDIRTRSFLTRNGFHHVGGTTHLLADQELMLYSKSLD